MGSTRLPGKVLMPIAGRPMLSYLLERLRRVRGLDRIVIATSTGPADDPIADHARSEQVDCVRGSELDVLGRFAMAIRSFLPDTVIRITADCPLIDPLLIEQALDRFHQADPRPDYVSNMLEPTWPYGMAVEVVRADILLEADRESSDPVEREHVTPYVYRRPQLFKLHSLTMAPDLSAQRWTVDTPEDFDLVSRIIADLHPRKSDFDLQDVLATLRAHPDWQYINQHVRQKIVN